MAAARLLCLPFMPLCLQVQLLTLGQLAVGSQGGGSVLLYSRELQQQGLKSVDSRRVHILESWFNGTNTDVSGCATVRLLGCLLHHGWSSVVGPPHVQAVWGLTCVFQGCLPACKAKRFTCGMSPYSTS